MRLADILSKVEMLYRKNLGVFDIKIEHTTSFTDNRFQSLDGDNNSDRQHGKNERPISLNHSSVNKRNLRQQDCSISPSRDPPYKHSTKPVAPRLLYGTL